eukprot:evm.model.NODE_35218_length_12717_cov_18.613981.1
MVAVAIKIARGSAPSTLIEDAYEDVMLTLPMAPSDGLFLDKAFFEQYNERATQIGLAASLDWEDDSGSEQRSEAPKKEVMAAKIKEKEEKDEKRREEEGKEKEDGVVVEGGVVEERGGGEGK